MSITGFSFENFETCFLSASVSGSVQKGANCLDGMPTLSNDSRDVALPGGQVKNHAIGRFSLRKDKLVRIFDELTDDEAKELLHASGPAQAVAFLRALLMMLPTVSEGRAPTLTQ
jgi:hypothetical protein